ncbi:A24 family peptidase [Conexibacter stalactiti]|uniref:A24 family peptidase n=1 Tax=Conexibacter stalactiti TaxID=1940611 RepID=A0ABU4HN04_9ACTN|nr:A24 family peptidase [Conexibacter stalactiti]MDW5594685.1 A24 family peptidase [Conexibacter stalactiti]MEC5035327.1 A24 family peptidase [Conexibacter stalactiti]
MADRRAVDLTLVLAVVAAALLALVVTVTAADLRAALLGVTLVAVVVPATWIDLDRRLIPNRLTAAGAIAALAIGLATDPARVPAQLLWGAAASGFLLAAALARPGGMGMGDVKLAAVLGLLLGPAVVVALLVALLAGALAGVAVAIRAGMRATRPSARPAREALRTATLPFGPFLALGAVIAWFAGADMLAAYLG